MKVMQKRYWLLAATIFSFGRKCRLRAGAA